MRSTGSRAADGIPDVPWVPLADFPKCTTTDLDEARDVISKLYVPHELKTRAGRALDVVLNAVVSQNMTLGHLTYGTDTRLDVPTLRSCYHINVTLRGQTSVYLPRVKRTVVTEVGRRGVILTPADSLAISWRSDVTQFVLKIPDSSLHDHLSAMVGLPVEALIDFQPEMDLQSESGSRYAAAITYYAHEIERAGGRLSPLLEGQFEKLIMTCLLMGSPHQYSDALASGQSHVRPLVIRHALDYIEGHITEPISVGDIARAAGVSARTLQNAFQRHLGSTPMSLIRDLRLTRVHHELCEADPALKTVGSIANKWGFLHQGRFGQQYRARYHCRPIDTLRRQH